MEQVSRDRSLKIPKEIYIYETSANSIDDRVAVKEVEATADDKKFNLNKERSFPFL